MGISRDDVVRISRLAGLRLDEATTEKFIAQLNEVLSYMDILKEVDTEGVEPTYHPAAGEGPLREDRDFPSLSPEACLENAPDRQGEFFLVPRVV